MPDMKKPSRSAWEATLSIVEQLRGAGHAALLAGGCVRDRLLGREPQDYDVVTDAHPDRVCALFPKARLVGVQFGVVVVQRFGHAIEVATFRSEGTYSDGRRPDAVVFGDERADALRRDFTVNGLFYDPAANRVIDHVNGQSDLKAGILRTIGDPDVRFAEDHLRMLRAVRIAARLGFAIDPPTSEAIQRLAHHLRSISPERIWMELEQILTEPTRARGWKLLCSLGLRAHLCSEWPVDAQGDAMAELRLALFPDRPIDPGLALSAVVAELDSHRIEAMGRSLHLSNELIDTTQWLIANLNRARRAAALEAADFKPLRASSRWPLLLELLRADLHAKGEDFLAFEAARQRGSAMTAEEAAPPALVSGADLIQLGMTAGPALGEVLREVYRAQLNERISTKAEGLAMARELSRNAE
jgi:poly(A) polymerase